MADTMIYALPDGDPAVGSDMVPVARGSTGGNFYVTAETISAIAGSVEATRAEAAEAVLATAIAAETTRAEGVEATNASAIAAETTRAEAAEAAIVAISGATGPAGPTGAEGPTGPMGPAGAGGTGGGGSGGLTQIAEFIVTTAQPTISLSGIPQTYRNLKLVVTGAESAGGGTGGVYVQFNGDTGSNYDWCAVYCQDSGANGQHTNGTTSITIGLIALNSAPAGQAGSTEATIYDYARTAWFKNVTGASFRRDSSIYVFETGGTWTNTAAVTDILLIIDGTDFAVGTVATLYGF